MSQEESAGARSPLVEIVPNFSEGRRQEVIDAIVAASLVSGVRVLNVQSDPDHNRLDMSLVGAPEAVRRSALAGAAKAVELIDMEEHRGSHPRMGAVDVIPFLPIRDVTMEDCIALARDTAREIAETLGLPVYCYDRAALSPERASLAEVRKGEYEGLKADVAAGRRLPDFGPHVIGRAGAVAVGARKPLVAFNMYLAGAARDEPAAKDVARRVRESSGGLKNVRAIGFFVPERGCLTVSMNLVDVDATPIYRAFELVKLEASRYGLPVISSEIVGLVPQAAISETAAFALRLDGFDPERQIVENAVQRAFAEGAGSELPAEAPAAGEAASFGARSLDAWLEALASDAPTPGGGAAAAVTAAEGAALVAMVAGVTAGKKGYEDVTERMTDIVKQTDELRDELVALAESDVQAFDRVMDAYRMPKGSEHEQSTRSRTIQDALLGAAEVPLRVAAHAVALLGLAAEVTERGNETAASDGMTAGHLLAAAARGAMANVEINVGSLRDSNAVARLRGELAALSGQAEELLAACTASFRRRVGG